VEASALTLFSLVENLRNLEPSSIRALYGTGNCRGQGKTGSQGIYVIGCQVRAGRKVDQRKPGRAMLREP
jgi:hypothetical protein